MTDNKGAGRLYLIIVLLYIGTSLGMGYLLPVRLNIYVSIAIPQMVLLVPALIYCKKRKISIRELVPYRKIKFSTGVLVVIAAYLMYPLMIVLNGVTLFFTDSAVMGMQTEIQKGSLLLGILFLAVLPACIEEFVFRGVLFQTYQRSGMLGAVFLSAALFGCMHMNVNQFVYASVLGIFLAFLLEATGSILSAMLAHFTLNATGVLLSFLIQRLNEGRAGAAGMEQLQGTFIQSDQMTQMILLTGILIWAVIAIGATAGAVGVYIGICKNCGRWEHVKHMFRGKNGEKRITVPLALAVLCTIAVMCLNF